MADELEPTVGLETPEGADFTPEETIPGVEIDVPAAAEEVPPPVIEEPPTESREAILARENAAIRQYATLLEQRVREGQPAPPVPMQAPDFFANMTPDQKQAWEASYKTLEPALRYREQQLLAAIDNRLRNAETVGERAALRLEYGDEFREMEPQLLQWQAELARQGTVLPLGELFLRQTGYQAIQQRRQQRNAATQQRRKPTAQSARPVAPPPAAVRTPGPSVTSDEEFMERMARETGIPRMRFKKRA